MEEIINQYGKIIIPIVVVAALVLIVTSLTSNGGIVDNLFQTMITNFAGKSGVTNEAGGETILLLNNLM